jgi:hypothetical protein
MPPRDGFTVTHFLIVADVDRSLFASTRRGFRRAHSEQGGPQRCTWLHSNREYLNCREVGGPRSSRSRRTSTARRVATSEIPTDILSRSDRASRSSNTVDVRPAVGWGFKGLPCAFYGPRAEPRGLEQRRLTPRPRRCLRRREGSPRSRRTRTRDREPPRRCPSLRPGALPAPAWRDFRTLRERAAASW